MRAELRDRGFQEPDTETPFDHLHEGQWVTFDLIESRDVDLGPGVRRERHYECPRCGYELTERAPTK